MQIQFDPRDRDACAGVLAVIAALHPGLSPTRLGRVFAYECSPADDEPADPAAAFEGATAPEQAFSPSPASDGPTDASTATLVTSVPAGTPADTTAVPTPPVGSDNGPNVTNGASPSSGVELDANGLPWDKRIHAGDADNKIKTKDGAWRKRRGVDETTVATVEAELRQVMAAPGPNATVAAAPSPTPATPAPAAPVSPPPAPEPSEAGNAPPPPVVASPVPAPAPAPTAAPPAPPPTPAAADTETGPAAVTPAVSDLPALMRKITALQTSGALTVADTNAVAVSLGLTSVRDLVQRPDLIASFDALLPEQAAQ